MAGGSQTERELREEVERLRRELEQARAEADLPAAAPAQGPRPLVRARLASRVIAVGELRRAKRRAEAATRAKSEFLANMSHELRTPMTAILGYVDLLLEDPEAQSSPGRRSDCLKTIKRNGEHLMRILGDILDLSKIEAGRLEVETIRTPLTEIVGDVEAVMRNAALAKDIGFDISSQGEIPATIETDPTRLRQVLMNLVGNAIKFTDQGGVRLMIRLAGREPPRLRFSVSDTGPGLSPSAQGQIFEAFTQADASTSRKFGGTGLGLPISRQLAQLLGGDIEVESLEGHGSTFSVTIGIGSLGDTAMLDSLAPAADPFAFGGEDPESTAAFLERVQQRSPGGRILVVEDGEDNRRLICLTLEKCGFEVSLAEDGAEGVEKALGARDGGEPFDLVVMDMQMPVIDGYEATRRLREAGYTAPVLALTAHAMTGDRERCLRAGCDAFETKPLERRRFLARVVDLLGKEEEPPTDRCLAGS